MKKLTTLILTAACLLFISASTFAPAPADFGSSAVQPIAVAESANVLNIAHLAAASVVAVGSSPLGASSKGAVEDAFSNAECMTADHSQTTECYEWRNWRRPRWWGLWSEYRHQLTTDEDQIMSAGWRTHSIVDAQGPPHGWWEPGLALVVHLPCEENIG